MKRGSLTMDSPVNPTKKANKAVFAGRRWRTRRSGPPGIRFRRKTHGLDRTPARVCRKTVEIPFSIWLKSSYIRHPGPRERRLEIPGAAPATRKMGRATLWESAHETEIATAGGPSWIRPRGTAPCSWRQSSSFPCRRWPASSVSLATRRAMTGMRAASSFGRKHCSH